MCGRGFAYPYPSRMQQLHQRPSLDPNPRLDPEVIGSFESSADAMAWVESVRAAMWEVSSAYTPPPSREHVSMLWGQGWQILERKKEAARARASAASAIPVVATGEPVAGDGAVGEVSAQ